MIDLGSDTHLPLSPLSLRFEELASRIWRGRRVKATAGRAIPAQRYVRSDLLRERAIGSLSMVVCTAALVLAWSATGWAAWVTQNIQLKPGWNAVYLTVQPEPRDTATVLANVPIESVWAWNGHGTAVQFVTNASELLPPDPDWLSYFPFAQSADQQDRVNNLLTIRGGRAYLIRLKGTQTVPWTVTGRAVVPATDWMPDSFNLVGFPADPAKKPTFQVMLGASTAHLPVKVEKLDSTGLWVPAASSDLVEPGQAYWVYCKGPSRYAGPLAVGLEQGGEVNFGRELSEQVVRIRNLTGNARTVSVKPKASVSPPAGSTALAGKVPLQYWDATVYQASPPWKPWKDLPEGGAVPFTIAAKGELALRVAVVRPPKSVDTELYQSVLEVNDGAGTVVSVPVVARGSASSGLVAASGARARAAATTVNPRAGLWVGTAKIDKVSHTGADPAVRPTPVATASEMSIRLIVHVDASGQARLLQHVTLMWKQGTTTTDPDGQQIVDAGHQALITDDSKLAQFTGAALRDGQPAGRRISSAAFGARDPSVITGWPMTGAFGSLLKSYLKLGYDDALNPFVHRYHPDHDNLGYDFDKDHSLAAGQESYDIVRYVELEFTADDPEKQTTQTGWGDSQFGGLYRETLPGTGATGIETGLHRETIHVASTFRLHRASRVAVLNDEVMP